MLAEFMISGEWLISLVVAIIGAIGGVGFKFYHDGRKAGRSESFTVDPPFPEVPFKKVLVPPTWDQHKALKDQVNKQEHRLELIENRLSAQHKEILEAGYLREIRLTDNLSQIIREEVRAVHERVNDVLKSCSEHICK